MFSNVTFSVLLDVLISIVISMTIHEAMHSFVAHWLGDDTPKEMGRLTLNPLKHIDIFTTVLLPLVLIALGLPPIFAAKPVPLDSSNIDYGDYGLALVGLSGPISNFILAVIGGVLLNSFLVVNQSIYNFLFIFVYVNVAFFVFNMIPFPPLDGSRLLYAFAPEPLQKIMRQIESFGFIVILLFLLIAFQFIGGPVGSLENDLVNFMIKL